MENSCIYITVARGLPELANFVKTELLPLGVQERISERGYHSKGERCNC